MITVRLNTEVMQLNKQDSLADMLEKQSYTQPYFSIILNEKFIPRSQYKEIFLCDGDIVETIFPMQGG